MMNKVELLWDGIIDYGIATEKELQLVTCLNGYNEKTLNDVVFIRTGYNDLNDFINE